MNYTGMRIKRKLHCYLEWVYLSILTLISSSLMAQSSFDKKVNSLINRTVPVVMEHELNHKLQEDKKVVLLDTRTKEEFEVSKISGAEFIDYDSFNPDMVSHIPKDEEIIVYCSVGYRSEKIGEKLKELGYSNVHNLFGGIFDWKNKDHEVVNQKNQPTDSVHTYNKNWSKWLEKGIKVYD